MSGKVTAFVSHSDCARHDTGWNHADHQGRLPSIMRNVYRDMIDLNEPLLDLEGRHASDEDLLRAHSAEHLARSRDWVEESDRQGTVIEPIDDLRVSDATWDASLAAAGSVLSAVDAVLAGEVRNAFCATRPAGSDAGRDAPGRFGLVNPIATGARYLVERLGIDPVLVLSWVPKTAAELSWLAEEGRIEVAGIAGEADGGDAWLSQLNRTLNDLGGRRSPAFVLLVTDFEVLGRDGEISGVSGGEIHAATRKVREYADQVCDGRLVSVLDHGYGPLLGAAVVQHLRALIGLSEKTD